MKSKVWLKKVNITKQENDFTQSIIGQINSFRKRRKIFARSYVSSQNWFAFSLKSADCYRIEIQNVQLKTGVGNLWLASQMWLFWWRNLARLLFS